MSNWDKYNSHNNPPPLPTEPQEMYGWQFSTPCELLKTDIERNPEFAGTGWKLVEYLMERLRRAEDRLKPVTDSELQAMFEKSVGIANCSKLANGEYMLDWTHIKWLGFLSAARLFGKVAQ